MRILRRFANGADADSLAVQLRRRRFARFLDLLAGFPAGATVLDIGGTGWFWRTIGADLLPRVRVTMVNLHAQAAPDPAIRTEVGDATDLRRYADRSFDVVFSNSVIEHVGGADAAARMAAEVRRLGRAYWVQTPNRFFPIEPHFLVPGFQFMPPTWRARLLTRCNLGWYQRQPDYQRALAEVRSIELLDAAQMRRLFPDGELVVERFCGLAKSITMHSPAAHWRRDG